MKLLSRIRKSKEASTVLSNIGYLSFLELASHFFPLITTPYLARVIGVDGFGALAVGAAIIAYFQTFTNYGFNYSAVREIARAKEDKQVVSDIVSRTLCAKMFLTIVSFIVLIILVLIVPYFNAYMPVILCTFLIIPGNVLFADWFFQAIEEMKYITIMNISMRLVFTILVFFVIKEPSDFLYQPILTGIGYFIPAIAALYLMKKRYSIKFKVMSLNQIILDVRNGFNLFITIFLPSIYSNLNILILGAYSGKNATGIYNGGTRFSTIAYCFFQVISRAVYPFFSRRLDKHSLYAVVSLTMATFMSFVLFCFAGPIVSIFLGSSFGETVSVLRILSFTPIAMSLMNSYGFNYLVLKEGGERIMRNIMIAVTILGICIGVPMTIKYSYIGVALTDLTIQMIRALLITMAALKLKKRN